jgi:hypothetical protein
VCSEKYELRLKKKRLEFRIYGNAAKKHGSTAVVLNIIDGDVTIDEGEETLDHRAQPDCFIQMVEINAWLALRISE